MFFVVFGSIQPQNHVQKQWRARRLDISTASWRLLDKTSQTHQLFFSSTRILSLVQENNITTTYEDNSARAGHTQNLRNEFDRTRDDGTCLMKGKPNQRTVNWSQSTPKHPFHAMCCPKQLQTTRALSSADQEKQITEKTWSSLQLVRTPHYPLLSHVLVYPCHCSFIGQSSAQLKLVRARDCHNFKNTEVSENCHWNFQKQQPCTKWCLKNI